MPRILVVDDEPLPRARLADAVRKLGYDVLVASAARAEAEIARPGAVAAVLCSARMREGSAVELAGRLAQRSGAPVVMTGVINEGAFAGDALRLGVRLGALLGPSPTTAELGRALLPLAAGPLSVIEDEADEWSGEDFLRTIDGPTRRFPVARVLHLAARVGATGTMVLEEQGDVVLVALRQGHLLYVGGVPGLVRGVPDRRDLVVDVGEAVAGGRSPDEVLDEATARLGAWAGERFGQGRGTVRWETSLQAPKGAFPLPHAVPRLLVRGLEDARGMVYVEGEWTRRAWAAVEVRLPHDSAEPRWGLDPRSLRVLRQLQGASALVDVLDLAGTADGPPRGEVLRAIDTLYCLGFLRLTGVADAPEPAPVVDEGEAAVLRERLAGWEKARPSEILGLTGEGPITPRKLEEAFRRVAGEVHPDQAFQQAPGVRSLREACFARVTAARDQLKDPVVLEEENRYLDALAKGLPWVTEDDKKVARAAFRRAEGLFRSRMWAEADAAYGEVLAADPLTWPHALAAARAGWLARRLTPDEALAAIDAIQTRRPTQQAEAQVAAGRILSVTGRAKEAQARFRKAVELDPENRDAQRELRLAARREGPTAPKGVVGKAAPGGSGSSEAGGLLAGLLRRRAEPPAEE